MDHKTIVNNLSKKIDREPKEISALIDGLATIIKEKCGNLSEIAIPGFGTFVPTKEDEKVITDLSTGKKILLPPQITLNFEPSIVFRKKVANNTNEQ